IEAIEHAFPFRVARYALRRGTGGRGKWRGGDGVVREYETRVPTEVTRVTERRLRAPRGLGKGGPGKKGKNALLTPDGERRLPGKVTFELRPGERLSIRTPGGGGWSSSS
ncbi:MAG: hydantoinase B/oxoprolinase family protein, partial [Deltaproteobacteria bacterium]|nr:hydantoinase B/oxoprolinase family protein [Deltaproteobacteria bacterium]